MRPNAGGAATGAAAAPDRRRWLLLVHVLPSTPSNLRVRTWRRLQQLGAIAVKQSVYVLPDSAAAREDFEWLKAEIEGGGGEATVFAADTVDGASDEALIAEFRRGAESAYLELARTIERTLKRGDGSRSRAAVRRELESRRQQFRDIERIDFFASGARDRVAALLATLDERSTQRAAADGGGPRAEGDLRHYRGRLWVTRPRPGVDRLASAWLIRRFIDPDATFGFVTDPAAAAQDAVPFDMFGVEFSHHADRCTFETLCERFAIRGAAIDRVAAVVHDLDLKDGRFGAPDAPTVGRIIDGLQAAHSSDDALLDQGLALFEALYRSFGKMPPAPARGRRRRQSA